MKRVIRFFVSDKGQKFYKSLNNKGMTTVEACVIIPITFTVIMLLVWLGILFYDRNALSQAAARAAIVGSEYSYLDNDEICEIVMKKTAELTQDKLILMAEPEVDVSVDATEIRVNVRGNLHLPESVFFGNIYNKRVWSIDITEPAPRLKPSVFVRTVHRISHGLDELKEEE